MGDPITSFFSKQSSIVKCDGDESTIEPVEFAMNLILRPFEYKRRFGEKQKPDDPPEKEGCVTRSLFMSGLLLWDSNTGRRTGMSDIAGNFTVEGVDEAQKAYYIRLYTEYLKKVPDLTLEAYLKDVNDNPSFTGIELKMLFVQVKRQLVQLNRVDLIKEVYQNCESRRFLYVPLTILSTGFIPGIFNHANGIIIDRLTNTVTRIEPENSPDNKVGVKIEERVNEGIKKFAEYLGMKNPTITPLDYICPQKIAQDKNCIFWTMFITREILNNIVNPKDGQLPKTPKETMDTFLQGKTKDDLERTIAIFKQELVKEIIPRGFSNQGEKSNCKATSWPDWEELMDKLTKRGGLRNGFKSSIKTRRKRKHGRKSKHSKNTRKT